VTDGLRLEITALKERIATLNRDNKSLSKDLLESQNTVSRLASAEHAARLSLDELKKGVRLILDKSKEAYNALDKAREDRRVAQDREKEEAHLADQRSEGLRVGYDTLKSR
jgi:chromosome segregation ATPase